MTRQTLVPGHARRVWLAKRWPGALLVASLVAIALVSGASTAVQQRQRFSASRNEIADTAADSLRSTMQQTLVSLRGAGAVVTPDGDVDVAAFDSFGLGLSVQPGLSALALEQAVPARDRQGFERRTGITIVDRLATGEFVPSPQRPAYLPVVAVSPDTPITRSILGFDIGNDPVRGPVAAAAIDTGTPQVSPPLALFTTGQRGFFVVTAVYRRGQPLDSERARRAAAVGAVSGAYVAADLIKLVEQQLPRGTQLAIGDGRQPVVGDVDLLGGGVTRQVPLGGRTWTVAVVVPGGPAYGIALATLATSLLLAGIVQLSISLARRREQELEVSGRRLEAEALHAESLSALSEALLEAPDVTAVVSAIVRCSSEAFQASGVRLGVLANDGHSIEFYGSEPLTNAEGAARESTTTDPDDVIARFTREMGSSLEGFDGGLLAATPLHVDRRPVGALCLMFDEPRSFDAAERVLLNDLASASARTLEQARLFAEVDAARALAERERSRVESSRRLSVEISRAETAEAAADIVLRRAIAVTSSIAGAVALAHEDGYLEFVAVRGMADGDAHKMPTLSFDDRAASTEAFRTGKESLATTAEQFQMQYPDGYRISGAAGRGVWGLPLVAQGSRIGAVVLILDTQHLPSEDDRSAVRALAAQVAQALRRARTSDQTREAAEQLQRAMLPAELPSLPGTVLTGLYRAATQILEVGGDWYDAVEMDEDTVMMAVGDVVGRGVSAAATMGQLRVAWRALAPQSGGPGTLLSALDRFSRDLPGAEVTTVVCAQLKVSTGRLRYACAGHLPPLVLSHSGSTHFLREGRSLPLAVADGYDRMEGETVLDAGDTLVLYSDGLVERRHESLDEGLERLRLAAEGISCSRPDLADELAATLVDGDLSVDDIAILTLTLLPIYRRALTRDPHELAPARASLRAWLEGQGWTEEPIEEMVMASGEALANAIEHADSVDPIVLRGWIDDDRITMRVTDRGRWMADEHSSDRGHGLAIMRALMDDVRVETDEHGTRVELSLSRASPVIPS